MGLQGVLVALAIVDFYGLKTVTAHLKASTCASVSRITLQIRTVPSTSVRPNSTRKPSPDRHMTGDMSDLHF